MPLTDDRRSVVMSEVMTPDKVNFGGNVYGGYLLDLLDRVAYSCAARYCGCYTVTLSVDQVLFKQPIYVGEFVTFYATVNYVGRTSIEVGIKVVAENILTGEIRHTNSCFFTMVAIDKTGKPTPVKPLELRTDLERRRFEEAEQRKEMRQAFTQEHAQRKQALKKKFDRPDGV